MRSLHLNDRALTYLLGALESILPDVQYSHMALLARCRYSVAKYSETGQAVAAE